MHDINTQHPSKEKKEKTRLSDVLGAFLLCIWFFVLAFNSLISSLLASFFFRGSIYIEFYGYFIRDLILGGALIFPFAICFIYIGIYALFTSSKKEIIPSLIFLGIFGGIIFLLSNLSGSVQLRTDNALIQSGSYSVIESTDFSVTRTRRRRGPNYYHLIIVDEYGAELRLRITYTQYLRIRTLFLLGRDTLRYPLTQGIRFYYAPNSRRFLYIDEYSIAVAKYERAHMYLQGRNRAQHGHSVRRNDETAASLFREAAYWFRRAAEQGQCCSQFRLGYIYHHGRGVSQNYEQAIYWYSKAAAQECSCVVDNLSLILESIEG